MISVVIPTFNSERFLQEALLSITRQSSRPQEVIVVDDSTNPACADIVRSFDDKRISYMRGPGKGLAGALNWGIAKAKGRYIARMDADDIADPRRLEIQKAFLNKWNLSICGSSLKLFGASSNIHRLPSDDAGIKYAMLFGCPIAHPTVFGEAIVLKNNKYDERMRLAEDYSLWCTLALKGYKFGNTSEVLLNYRVHASQSTTRFLVENYKASALVAGSYAQRVLTGESAERLGKLDNGFRQDFTLHEAEEFVNIGIRASEELCSPINTLEPYVTSVYRRVRPLRPSVILSYAKSVRKVSPRIKKRNIVYLLAAVLLKMERESNVYRVMRRFAR